MSVYDEVSELTGFDRKTCKMVILAFMHNGAPLPKLGTSPHEAEAERLMARMKELNVTILDVDKPKLGDGTPDAALFIAEEAFRAGYKAAADRARAFHPTRIESDAAHIEAAWSAFEPSEQAKELS